MSYLERAQEVATSGGQPCKMGKALAGMDATTKADVVEAVRSDVSAPALSKILREDGYDISADSVRRHRAGGCMTCAEVFPG